MKKLLILFIITLVFSGCSRIMEIKDSLSEPLTLQVGDKMPDMSGIKVTKVLPWFSLLFGKSGMRHYTGLFGEVWTMEVFLLCDGELLENPFGFYLSELATVYLDGNMDGIIDGVIVIGSKKLSIGETAPDCPPPTTKI